MTPNPQACVTTRKAPPRAVKDTTRASAGIGGDLPADDHRRSRRLQDSTARPNYNVSSSDDEDGEDHDSRYDDITDDDYDEAELELMPRVASADLRGIVDATSYSSPSRKRAASPSRTESLGPSPKRRSLRGSQVHHVTATTAESPLCDSNALPVVSTGHSRRKRSATPRKPRRKSKGVRSSSKAQRKAIAVGDTAEVPTIFDTGRIPPWEQLPYLILVQIMAHAASPLSDHASVRWLLQTSQVCRTFAEPAVTALYRSPPLLTPAMAHNLGTLLARPATGLMFNYRQKVESLTMDIGVLDSHVHKGRHLDVRSLLINCPRLAGADICHYKDMSPYRQLDDNIKWSYPHSLFEGLHYQAEDSALSISQPNSQPIKFKDWRWSSRMLGDLSLKDVKQIHLSSNFNSLVKLNFVNFQRPALHAKDADAPETIAEDRQYAEAFAEMLEVLPQLRHLVLESSTVANEILLPLLPKQLRHLELINCWDVTLESFTDYLISKGHQLRSLTLDHNQSLSLGFLPVLASACPNLQALRMNLTYFSQHEFYNDSDPMYEVLLEPHQVPCWPSTLRVLELEHLRKWEAAAAEILFQSLLDSAADLPKLRRLTVKAILNIPWRQRSQIRDVWVARLKRAFQRKSPDPVPNGTLRPQFNKEITPAPRTERSRSKSAELTPSRRSSRIAVQTSGPSSRASSIARDLRTHGPGRISYQEPDTDEDFDGVSQSQHLDEDDEQHAPSPPSTDCYIQGMCDEVDIKVDNQKLMETQFRMDDFLDSEHAVSDEEWTGDNQEDEGADYAW